MNFIGIDMSLRSTAITIWNSNGYHFLSYMKNYDKPTKWTKLLGDYITVKNVSYKQSEDYSELENFKILDYDNNTDIMIEDIKNLLVGSKIVFGIEGYSYTSETSSLIDIVSMSTMLRLKMIKKLNAEMIIYSPSTIKKETSGLCYGWKAKGKRVITYSTRNTDYIAGGNFKKPQMLKALNDYPCDSNLSKFTKEHFDVLYSMATIPAPIPDLIDSYWVLKVLMNEKVFHIKNILEE